MVGQAEGVTGKPAVLVGSGAGRAWGQALAESWTEVGTRCQAPGPRLPPAAEPLALRPQRGWALLGPKRSTVVEPGGAILGRQVRVGLETLGRHSPLLLQTRLPVLFPPHEPQTSWGPRVLQVFQVWGHREGWRRVFGQGDLPKPFRAPPCSSTRPEPAPSHCPEMCRSTKDIPGRKGGSLTQRGGLHVFPQLFHAARKGWRQQGPMDTAPAPWGSEGSAPPSVRPRRSTCSQASLWDVPQPPKRLLGCRPGTPSPSQPSPTQDSPGSMCVHAHVGETDRDMGVHTGRRTRSRAQSEPPPGKSKQEARTNVSECYILQ